MIIRLNEANNIEKLSQESTGYKTLKSLCDKYNYEIDEAANYVKGSNVTTAVSILKKQSASDFLPEAFIYNSKTSKWEAEINFNKTSLDFSDLQDYADSANDTLEFFKKLEDFDLTSLAFINPEEM